MKPRSKSDPWRILLVAALILTVLDAAVLVLTWRLPQGYPTETPYVRGVSTEATTEKRENRIDGDDLVAGYAVMDAMLEARLAQAVGAERVDRLAPPEAVRTAVTGSPAPAEDDVQRWLSDWKAALERGGIAPAPPPTSTPATSTAP